MGKRRSPQQIGRKRGVMEWTLLVSGMVAAALWVMSGWWCPHVELGDCKIALCRGIVYFFDLPPEAPQNTSTASSKTLRQKIEDERVRHLNEGWRRLVRGIDGRGWRWNGMTELAANMAFIEPTCLRWTSPVWPIPLVLWALAETLWWSVRQTERRRARSGLCSTCGYSRAGLAPAARCPECGNNG